MPLSNTGIDRFLAQNYYSKTQLNAGQLDSRYFAESEFIATSAGAGDAGKPVKLNGSGLVDTTMLTGSLTDFALLAGRAGGQTLYGDTAANGDIIIHGTSNATRTTSYVLLQPTAGNVGIGVLSPQRALHVYGAADAYVRVSTSTFTTGADFGFDASKLYIWNYSNTDFQIATNNTPRFTISAAGDITTTGTITQAGAPVATTTNTLTLTNKTLDTPNLGLSNWYLSVLSGVDPLINFDSNDFLSYVRSPNTLNMLIGGGIAASVTAGGLTVGGVAVPTISSTNTLTNKTLTDPFISRVYGSGSPNGDLTLEGTTSATKTSSYISMQPTGGPVVIGGTTTDHQFEIQDQGASNYRLTVNLDFSGVNYLNSFSSAVGVSTPAPLTIVSSALSTTGDTFRIETTKSPASNATGSPGQIAWDTGFLYVCTATDTWERVALTGGY